MFIVLWQSPLEQYWNAWDTPTNQPFMDSHHGSVLFPVVSWPLLWSLSKPHTSTLFLSPLASNSLSCTSETEPVRPSKKLRSHPNRLGKHCHGPRGTWQNHAKFVCMVNHKWTNLAYQTIGNGICWIFSFFMYKAYGLQNYFEEGLIVSLISFDYPYEWYERQTHLLFVNDYKPGLGSKNESQGRRCREDRSELKFE